MTDSSNSTYYVKNGRLREEVHTSRVSEDGFFLLGYRAVFPCGTELSVPYGGTEVEGA